MIKPPNRSAAWGAAELPKVFLALSRDDLTRVEAPVRGAEDLVVQEWIEGPDSRIFFHLACNDERGRPIASFSGRKPRQHPIGIGYTGAAEPPTDSGVETAARRVLDATPLRGLGSVEFKRNPRDGGLKIMEPTVGPVSAQSNLATANGVNSAYRAYCAHVGEEAMPDPLLSGPTQFFLLVPGFATLLAGRTDGTVSVGEFLRPYRGSRYFADLTRGDPVPFLLHAGHRPASSLAGVIRRRARAAGA